MNFTVNYAALRLKATCQYTHGKWMRQSTPVRAGPTRVAVGACTLRHVEREKVTLASCAFLHYKDAGTEFRNEKRMKKELIHTSHHDISTGTAKGIN